MQYERGSDISQVGTYAENCEWVPGFHFQKKKNPLFGQLYASIELTSEGEANGPYLTPLIARIVLRMSGYN